VAALCADRAHQRLLGRVHADVPGNHSRRDRRRADLHAQFSLSHACWLATYPIAGVLGSAVGLPATAWLLAASSAVALAVAALAWPAPDRHTRLATAH
jgi:hypothetical protein